AKIGAVMVPTNPASTAAEMEYILAHSEARLAVTEAQYAAPLHAVRDRCAALGDVIECRPASSVLAGMPDRAPDSSVASGALASRKHPSAPPPNPRGAPPPHATSLSGGEVMAKAMRVGPEARPLVVPPLFPAGAQLHAFLPMLLSGGSLALVERFSAS